MKKLKTIATHAKIKKILKKDMQSTGWTVRDKKHAVIYITRDKDYGHICDTMGEKIEEIYTGRNAKYKYINVAVLKNGVHIVHRNPK